MHKLNQITMKTKLFFRIICILSALLINLSLLKPGFSQATVEYHNLSVDGSIKGAISIMFPEGWSTYWKFPGPNGFIPNLRVLDKENLKSFSISWPYPKKLGPKNFTYLGFDNELLLPVELEKFDQNRNISLQLNISFGICKTACVVQNKTVVISDKSDINYLVLDKLQKSKNRITMITGLGSSNRCKIKKIADKEYQITLENPLMKSRTLVSDALVDYQGSSWIIENQSFYPELGRVEALLKLKDPSNKEIEKENFSILYLNNHTPKRTIGCPS